MLPRGSTRCQEHAGGVSPVAVPLCCRRARGAPERGSWSVRQPGSKKGGMDRQMDVWTGEIGPATPPLSPHREVTQTLSFQSSLLPHPAAVAHGDSGSPFPSSGCSARSWGLLPAGDHLPASTAASSTQPQPLLLGGAPCLPTLLRAPTSHQHPGTPLYGWHLPRAPGWSWW